MYTIRAIHHVIDGDGKHHGIQEVVRPCANGYTKALHDDKPSLTIQDTSVRYTLGKGAFEFTEIYVENIHGKTVDRVHSL